MENSFLEKYAYLLCHYCLELKKGDKLYVSTTTLAEPLVKEIWRESVRIGAIMETDLDFEDKNTILLQEGSEELIRHVSPWYDEAIRTFDAYLHIRAPFSTKQTTPIDPEKSKLRGAALSATQKVYFERIATRDLKRSLCQYPTLASANEAGMTLQEYEYFVLNACCLFDEDPIASWLEVRRTQQSIVDMLNSKKEIRYLGEGTDLTFRTEGRTWINSDGRNNMPSGEVFTSPIEDSVNGYITFNFPGIYGGNEVRDVCLHVKDGYIEHWEASYGKDYLDHIFTIPGTRRFGEAAIGTNYNIQQMTKNILFDEKIGGTVHLAIGQSYLQCGGKNESSVHWDMITDLGSSGKIFADGELVYENRHFL